MKTQGEKCPNDTNRDGDCHLCCRCEEYRKAPSREAPAGGSLLQRNEMANALVDAIDVGGGTLDIPAMKCPPAS